MVAIFFRLSANGYFRLSDWKRSRDFSDYHERVANGFDVRTEAWLPSLPQLGGKLSWARYYGDRVGVFGPDDLQKKSRAVYPGRQLYARAAGGHLDAKKRLMPAAGATNSLSALTSPGSSARRLKPSSIPTAFALTERWRDRGTIWWIETTLSSLSIKKDRLFSITASQSVSGIESSKLMLNLNITSRYTVTGIGWQGDDFFCRWRQRLLCKRRLSALSARMASCWSQSLSAGRAGAR
ncbi:inverse autotransporter beta domain-containing protein [Pantoea tagorei]